MNMMVSNEVAEGYKRLKTLLGKKKGKENENVSECDGNK